MNHTLHPILENAGTTVRLVNTATAETVATLDYSESGICDDPVWGGMWTLEVPGREPEHYIEAVPTDVPTVTNARKTVRRAIAWSLLRLG